MPIAVKDMFTLPWRGPRDGSPLEALPPGESGVYRLLRDAGAVVVGVTQMHFWGGGSTGHVSAYGPVGNAWNAEHCGGGSSGGSAAAVGARLVAGAVGTDGGGSMRLPAAYNGITGLKGTFGSTPRDGYTHAHASMGVGGPMCRDAADARLLGSVLFDRALPEGVADAAGLRVGLVRSPFWDDVDPEVEAACRAGDRGDGLADRRARAGGRRARAGRHRDPADARGTARPERRGPGRSRPAHARASSSTSCSCPRTW